MNFEDYRTIFIIGTLICVLLAATPALSIFISLPKSGEKFSEFWYLGPNHMAEDYPFNVTVDEQYNIYLDIVNHMGNSIYYAVYVKFRNETQLLPNATSSLPSPLPAVYEFRAFVQDGATWERPFLFSFSEISVLGDSCSVNKLVINNYLVNMNSSANWNAERNGFYFQLFFELWFYDVSLKSLHFHNRFVTLWLNMTG